MRAIGRYLVLLIFSVVLVACGSSDQEQDTTAPVITLTGANPQVIEVGSAYVELGATATDNRDGDLSNAIVIDASQVDTSVPGSYTVTYSATDTAGNRGTTTRTVVVEDTTPPVITLLGDDPQVIEAGSAYVELGATASDNLDGDVGGTIIIDASTVNTTVPGDYMVSYDVSDAAGNAAVTVVRAVLVRDTTPPVITLLGNDPQVIISGNPYSELGATATDSLDGDLSPSINIDSSAVDTLVVGDYTVTYDVTDAAGNAAVTVTRTVRVELPPPPAAPQVSVEGDIKQLIFTWDEVANADYYRLMENADGHSGFTQVGGDIPNLETSVERDIAVHAHDWVNALYTVHACNLGGCSGSSEVSATSLMLDTIGYFKASNTGQPDRFGSSVALSGDGNTMAVGAPGEGSSAGGIDGNQDNDDSPRAGAVYLFRFDGTSWFQQSYVKAPNAGENDRFGSAVALSEDGGTLVVGAPGEGSAAADIDGDQNDDSAPGAGAVYIFGHGSDGWAQEAYLKASNAAEGDGFGVDVALSADGTVLAIAASGEDSSAIGINGNQLDDTAPQSGAVYLFRSADTVWSQQAYIKASNTDADDQFGGAIDLNADGNTLAVGAIGEDSIATEIDGNQMDNSRQETGAVYVFAYGADGWYQQEYIKATNTPTYEGEHFGNSVALSASGGVLAVGALRDDASVPPPADPRSDDSCCAEGSIYLFASTEGHWAPTDVIRPSVQDESDFFGTQVALSADGETVIATAWREDGGTRGVNGDPTDNSVGEAGAAYVFRFDGTAWNQVSYVKANNTLVGQIPGGGVSVAYGVAADLSSDGNTLAIGSSVEQGRSTGINGDPFNLYPASEPNETFAGAVYLY